MICPKCGASKTTIGKYAYPSNDEIYRRRHCSECNHIFFTCEFPIETTDEVLVAFGADEEPDQRVVYRKLRNDKIIELFDAGVEIRDIMMQLHVGENVVRGVLSKTGRSAKNRRMMRNEEIRNRIADGATVKDIMNQYGLQESAVRKIIKDVQKPRWVTLAKLHAAILEDIDNGMTAIETAKKNGVSKVTVYRVIKRREGKTND